MRGYRLPLYSSCAMCETLVSFEDFLGQCLTQLYDRLPLCCSLCDAQHHGSITCALRSIAGALRSIVPLSGLHVHIAVLQYCRVMKE